MRRIVFLAAVFVAGAAVAGAPEPSASMKSEAEIVEWTKHAMQSVFNVSFADLDEKISAAKKNFTSKGWDALKSAGFDSQIVAIHNLRLVCHISEEGGTSAVKTGPVWRVQIPIARTCETQTKRVVWTFLTEVVVSRTPDGNLKIDDFTARDR